MTLRFKTLLIMGVSLAALMAVVYLVTSRILLSGYVRLEHQRIVRNAHRAKNALQHEVEALNSKIADWSVWDDSWAFMEDHHPDFIKSNMGDETFANLKLNLMVFVDVEGNVAHGKCMDLHAHKEIHLPAALLARLKPKDALLVHPHNDHRLAGVFVSEQGPLLLASRPIVQSSGAGPIRGTLIFGQFLDQTMTRSLSDITHQVITITSANQEILANTRQARLATLTSLSPPLVQITDEGRGICASFLVNDVYGQPALVVRVDDGRDIYSQGLMSLHYFLASLVVVGLSVGLVMRLLLDRFVLSPLSCLRDGVRRIGSGGDLSTPITLRGRDELADLAGEFNRMLSILANTQEQLRSARDQAQAATDAKSAFLATVSHEVRTPMTAILGYADLLLDDDHPRQQQQGYLQIIRRNGEHLLAIVNDILDISKIEAGRMTAERIESSPVQIVREVAATMQTRACDKGLALSVALDLPLPRTIRSDPTRLRQILVNLVGNAIKFTLAGEVRIILRMERAAASSPAVSPNQHPAPASASQHSALCFDVVDTGIGLSDEQQAKLFDCFVQGDLTYARRFGGSGLGLAISRRLAQLLGGAITLRSAPGRGSTFTLRIDLGTHEGLQLMTTMPDYQEPSNQRDRAELHAGAFAGRVLLAEDGPDNQRLLWHMLAKAGLTVTLADNGLIACEKALQANSAGQPFDVILMDMQMPVLDGYSAVARLRQAGYSGSIVALTAHTMAGDRARCLDAGCDDYASKPVDRLELLRLIRIHIESSRKHREAARAA